MNNFELIPTFNDFKKILNEKKKDQQYDSGCIMGYFNTSFKNPKIKSDDLYNNEDNEYGLEVEPHCTVLYGLTDKEIDEDEIIKLFTMIDGPIVSTNKITLFENDKYDVVKWDIDSEELTILNKMLTSMFPYKSSFPDYHAHTTIAYCLPGKGKEYTKEYKKSFNKKIDYWVYSKSDGKKIKIIPGKGSEIIRQSINESLNKILRQSIDESIISEIELLSYKNKEDKSFEYNGYTVKITKHDKFDESYYCTVYLGDLYKMGLRGAVDYNKAKEAAIHFINNETNEKYFLINEMTHVPNKPGKFKQGYYKIQNIDKYLGNPVDIVYRSSWEYKFMVYCDMTPGVKKWGSEVFRIPYIDFKGHNRIYIPDFYLETYNEKTPGLMNRFLIEIKPEKEIREPIIPTGNINEKKLKKIEYELAVWQKNKYKWTYTKDWCKNRDIKFWLVTEKHLDLFKV